MGGCTGATITFGLHVRRASKLSNGALGVLPYCTITTHEARPKMLVASDSLEIEYHQPWSAPLIH